MFQSSDSHKISVQVIRVISHGLETFQVRVNGTLSNVFLSEPAAWQAANRLANKTGGELNLELKTAA